MGQRRLREQAWEWLQSLLIYGAIAILWLWQLGAGSLMPGEELPVDQGQQWLEPLWSTGFTLSEFLGTLGQSPLTVALIALGQSLGADSPWGTRLPITVLNILSLPLLYGIGKTLYGKRISALLAVVVYGTSLGVTYWARLATSNSLLLPLTLLYLTNLLFCRRDLRGSLALGVSLTALALTDLPTALMLGISGLIFLGWDTPRLLRTPLFGIGLGLGLLPAIAWWGYYDWQQGGLRDLFVLTNGAKNFGWLWIGGSFPGLIFALTGIQQARHAQHWSWGRFLICQGGIYSLLVILAPWPKGSLIMPLFAPFALGAAVSLTEAYHSTHWVYPSWWRQGLLISGGGLMGGLTWVYWQAIALGNQTGQPWSLWLLGLLAMVMMMTATLLGQQKSEFIAVLFWGLFVCLVLAIHSPLWLVFLNWTNP
ncbi:MAG: hypothetical protein RLZZ490_814 [Cyanobacteriota bacterium]|jgi:4-amino-4-deoxy-L-arabinose transferase-like glycosyltransferase